MDDRETTHKPDKPTRPPKVSALRPRDSTSIGTLAMSVKPDTRQLRRVFRAIAKHAEALANELDAIDAEDEDTDED